MILKCMLSERQMQFADDVMLPAHWIKKESGSLGLTVSFAITKIGYVIAGEWLYSLFVVDDNIH